MIDFTGAKDTTDRPTPTKYEVKVDRKIHLVVSYLTLYKVVQVGTGKLVMDKLSRKHARTYRDFLNRKQ